MGETKHLLKSRVPALQTPDADSCTLTP